MTSYTYKIQVEVNDQLVMFEPDEDRNYRAMLDPAHLENGAKLEVQLLQAIAEVIESVVK
ncbi:hypothetical protein AAE02nite_21610 [Adhaeribacter aerolatus]|uniref:Uncharacterized protein n=2 Tax=Adhaeribacter aerolatus TaxID=670289 RepID=A0A512AYA5_9BACT|nr:hypothetical protein AAE02nite_21610 [Adhaeribacter aerolatus]